jgi:serine/threonine-protein kinase
MPEPFVPAYPRPSLASRLRQWFGRKPAAGGPASAQSQPPSKSGAGPESTLQWPTPGAKSGRRLPQLADYALEHVIARTDRNTIFRATERASGRLVALKTIQLGHATPDERALWRERFLRESAAAARLKHENIVRVHAGGVQGEGEGLIGWLAMEWVQGTDLTRYAVAARLLPEEVVLQIASRVALALAFAHRNGIVHRDIKPANVLFDPTSGAVKVTDFGSARIADSVATRSGVLMGTPAYMAPEQLSGAEATPQCDLYALGVMVFELLTGQRPFESDSMGQLLALIARQPPPKLRTLRPDLPPLLEDIVARLLAKKPEERQADARQLAIELRLAQASCDRTTPGNVAAQWADTEPLDHAAMAAMMAEAAANVPQNGVSPTPGGPAIQGTIGGNHPPRG